MVSEKVRADSYGVMTGAQIVKKITNKVFLKKVLTYTFLFAII